MAKYGLTSGAIGPRVQREVSFGFVYRKVFKATTAECQRLRREGWELLSGTPAESLWRRPVQTEGASRES